MEKSLLGRLLGKDELICLICSEYYKDPRILPCQHTFCRKCLQQVFDQKQAKTSAKISTILCPKCHVVTALPEIGVSGFPLDINIRKKKDEFMEKLVDGSKPSAAHPDLDNKSHSLPKTARRVFEERQKEQEAARPSFMKHEWSTHIDPEGGFDSPRGSTDDLEYLKRSRPTFSPGTKRNQMVDGLIRSRRERSPHVNTRNAPSATPRFTPLDPDIQNDVHGYRPFSGSRPARLASPRSKLSSGVHHKSDPGLETFGSPSTSDGFLSPDYVGVSGPSRSWKETNNNIPSSFKAKDTVSETTESSGATDRQSRLRRQVHFQDSKSSINKDGTKASDDLRKSGHSPCSDDNKTTATDVSSKNRTRASHSEDPYVSRKTDAQSQHRPEAKLTNRTTPTFVPSTEAHKVPSAPSSLSNSQSSSTRTTSQNVPSATEFKPSADSPRLSNTTKMSTSADQLRSKPSAPSAAKPVPPQSSNVASQRPSPSASAAAKPSSPYFSSASSSSTATATGTESKVETVQFSEQGRTSPGKVRRRPTIPTSLRSPTDKSLSPTRSRTSPTQRSSSTLPRDHKPSVFTFDGAAKSEHLSGSQSATDVQTGVKTSRTAPSRDRVTSSGKKSINSDKSDVSAPAVGRDNELGHVKGRQVEQCSASTVKPDTGSHHFSSSCYRSRTGDRPSGCVGVDTSSQNSAGISDAHSEYNEVSEAAKTASRKEAGRPRHGLEQVIGGTPPDRTIRRPSDVATAATGSSSRAASDGSVSARHRHDAKSTINNRPDNTTPIVVGTSQAGNISVTQVKGQTDQTRTDNGSEGSAAYVGDNSGQTTGWSSASDFRSASVTSEAERNVINRSEPKYGRPNERPPGDRVSIAHHKPEKINRTWTTDGSNGTSDIGNVTSTARDIPIFRGKEPMNTRRQQAQTAHTTTSGYRCTPADQVNGVNDKHFDEQDALKESSVASSENKTSRQRLLSDASESHLKCDSLYSEDESAESDDEGQSRETSWRDIYQDIYDDITREVSREREQRVGKREQRISNTTDTSQTEDLLNTSHDTDQSSVKDDTTQTPGGRISSAERQLGGATVLEEPQEEEEEEEDMTPERPVYSTSELWCVEKREYEMPTSVVILSNGTTVVAEFNSGRLQYFDATGTFMHNVDGIKPFCIAVNKADQVIVADRKNKTIRGFDEFGVDTVQWEDNQFKWISGIGCLSNGNLVIYNRDNYKVGIYTKAGEKIFEFGSYGERDTQLCMADFLAVDSKDRILLCDSGNHCIKVFDVNGRFLNKFGTRGHKNGQMEWPKGICCDNSDNIIVADNRNSRVSLYSSDGEFVQHLVRSFPNPYGVCLNRDNSLLGISHYALTGFSQLAMYKVTDFTPGDTSDETDVPGSGPAVQSPEGNDESAKVQAS